MSEGPGSRPAGGEAAGGAAADGEVVAGAAETGDADSPLAAELRELAKSLPARLDASPEDVDVAVVRLVLTLVEFIRRVLEHQAVRRMEGGGLTDEEVERLGLALLRLDERLAEIKEAFGLGDEDLNIDLGPLGRLL